MTTYENESDNGAPDEDLLEEQERRGYGEDEGERGESLGEEDRSGE